MRSHLTKTGLVVALLSLVMLIGGCEGYVQEPWVPDAETYKQERTRSAQAQKELRERLAQVQTDR